MATAVHYRTQSLDRRTDRSLIERDFARQFGDADPTAAAAAYDSDTTFSTFTTTRSNFPRSTSANALENFDDGNDVTDVAWRRAASTAVAKGQGVGRGRVLRKSGLTTSRTGELKLSTSNATDTLQRLSRSRSRFNSTSSDINDDKSASASTADTVGAILTVSAVSNPAAASRSRTPSLSRLDSTTKKVEVEVRSPTAPVQQQQQQTRQRRASSGSVAACRQFEDELSDWTATLDSMTNKLSGRKPETSRFSTTNFVVGESAPSSSPYKEFQSEDEMVCRRAAQERRQDWSATLPLNGERTPSSTVSRTISTLSRSRQNVPTSAFSRVNGNAGSFTGNNRVNGERGYASDSEDSMDWLERQRNRLNGDGTNRRYRGPPRTDVEKRLVAELKASQERLFQSKLDDLESSLVDRSGMMTSWTGRRQWSSDVNGLNDGYATDSGLLQSTAWSQHTNGYSSGAAGTLPSGYKPTSGRTLSSSVSAYLDQNPVAEETISKTTVHKTSNGYTPDRLDTLESRQRSNTLPSGLYQPSVRRRAPAAERADSGYYTETRQAFEFTTAVDRQNSQQVHQQQPLVTRLPADLTLPRGRTLVTTVTDEEIHLRPIGPGVQTLEQPQLATQLNQRLLAIQSEQAGSSASLATLPLTNSQIQYQPRMQQQQQASYQRGSTLPSQSASFQMYVTPPSDSQRNIAGYATVHGRHAAGTGFGQNEIRIPAAYRTGGGGGSGDVGGGQLRRTQSTNNTLELANGFMGGGIEYNMATSSTVQNGVYDTVGNKSFGAQFRQQQPPQQNIPVTPLSVSHQLHQQPTSTGTFTRHRRTQSMGYQNGDIRYEPTVTRPPPPPADDPSLRLMDGGGASSAIYDTTATWRLQQQAVNDQRSSMPFASSGSQQILQQQQQPQRQHRQGHVTVQNPGYDVNTIQSSSMSSSHQRSGLLPAASYQQTTNYRSYVGNDVALQPASQPSPLTSTTNQQQTDTIANYDFVDSNRTGMQNRSYTMSWQQQPVSQNGSSQSAASFGIVQNGEHFATGRQHQAATLPRQPSMTSSSGVQRTSDTEWNVEQAFFPSNSAQRPLQQQQQQQQQRVTSVNATVNGNEFMSPNYQQQQQLQLQLLLQQQQQQQQQQEQQQRQSQQLFFSQATSGAPADNRSVTLPAGIRPPTIEPNDYTIKRVQSVEQYQQSTAAMTATSNRWPLLRQDDESGLGNTMTSSWTSPSMRAGGDGYRISSTSNETEVSSSNVSADQSSSGSFTMFGDIGVQPPVMLPITVKFVTDTSKFWYRPELSRDEAIEILKNQPPGSFIVRNSNSYAGAFALVIKLSQVPANIQSKGVSPGDLVRNFLIETTAQGVRLKGNKNEPVFGSLAALIYQHSITPISLPCKLVIPYNVETSPTATLSNQSRNTLQQPAACLVVYINSVEVESLTGPDAVDKAVTQTLKLAESNPLTVTLAQFKVSAQGITLTDNKRRLFFRRHYNLDAIRYCGVDSRSRKWTYQDDHAKGRLDSRIFGFVARKPGSNTGNECHVLADYDPEQPAADIVNFVCKMTAGIVTK